MKINVKAKKYFGQNFLKDEIVSTQIIEAMPRLGTKIVEIGPGLGDLTKHLVMSDKVVAFEVDTDLKPFLSDRFCNQINSGRLRLIFDDVLERWRTHLVEEDYVLVANLPYYVATKIILKALRDKHCKAICVMVQKEVAIKFCANAGKKAFSPLSVLAQFCGVRKYYFQVPQEAFNPPPKVTSAVFSVIKNRHLADRDFENFLKVCFSAPRKTLFKNLTQQFDKMNLTQCFEILGFKATARPHEVEDYEYLYKKLKGK